MKSLIGGKNNSDLETNSHPIRSHPIQSKRGAPKVSITYADAVMMKRPENDTDSKLAWLQSRSIICRPSSTIDVQVLNTVKQSKQFPYQIIEGSECNIMEIFDEKTGSYGDVSFAGFKMFYLMWIR